MVTESTVLLVASYRDHATAAACREAVDSEAIANGSRVLGMAVLERCSDGKVLINQIGAEATISDESAGRTWLVVGLFAPELLLAPTYRLGIRGFRNLVRRHDVREMGVAVDDYLPPSTTAFIALIDRNDLSIVSDLLASADTVTTRPIDQRDCAEIASALEEARSLAHSTARPQ